MYVRKKPAAGGSAGRISGRRILRKQPANGCVISKRPGLQPAAAPGRYSAGYFSDVEIMVEDAGFALYVKPLFGALAALTVLVIALTAGYCARSHGRSFWLWFGLSLALPIVSYFGLLTLILHQHANQDQRLLNEARAILAAAARAAHPEEH